MANTVDAADLASRYITIVEDALSNKININKAVVERQILINNNPDPNGRNKGNRADLEEVASQFDNKEEVPRS